MGKGTCNGEGCIRKRKDSRSQKPRRRTRQVQNRGFHAHGTGAAIHQALNLSVHILQHVLGRGAAGPVIAVENGEVTILGKARGSKNGNNMLMSLVEKSGGINFEKPFSLAYSGLSDMLLQKYISDSAHLYQGKAVHLPRQQSVPEKKRCIKGSGEKQRRGLRDLLPRQK